MVECKIAASPQHLRSMSCPLLAAVPVLAAGPRGPCQRWNTPPLPARPGQLGEWTCPGINCRSIHCVLGGLSSGGSAGAATGTVSDPIPPRRRTIAVTQAQRSPALSSSQNLGR
ncbi:hypothetical protein CDD80_974 [Ophiocordyceps camponoti-rufipedis]|uniref:Uncharacterized protein n=1 Tax=Ophiocordyceps camponoti-rufipedis TaxID=2004952 RepID=A0A2C5ZBA6_9HYPO|nr:hypothetical protein CDD80_974 [Ophiocordyceps camponoti-rufipedis]